MKQIIETLNYTIKELANIMNTASKGDNIKVIMEIEKLRQELLELKKEFSEKRDNK